MSVIKHVAYRALMPRLYHWQSFGSDKEKGSIDGRIDALEFPVMRVMGPFWSFGIRVPTIEPLDEAKLPADSIYALRLMQEHRDVVGATEAGDPPDHKLSNMHRPQFFRAGVESFYSYDSLGLDGDDYFPARNTSPYYASASRLSIIGVHTLKDQQENLTKAKLLECTPVGDKQLPKGDTTELMLATIGGNPGYRDKQAAYLPACQLIGGRIGFRGTNEYLFKLRERLGLSVDESVYEEEIPNIVYLLPDGFALYGSLHVPWRSAKVFGWFKVSTNTNTDIEGFEQATPGAAVQGKRADREESNSIAELTIWAETPHAYNRQENSWSVAVKELRELLFTKNGPKWLRLSANDELDESDLYWPLEPESRRGKFDFLLQRKVPADHRVFVRENALAARLAERNIASAPLSVLTLTPARFELYKKDSSLVLITANTVLSKEDAGELQQKLSSAYVFNGAENKELLTINNGDPLELAVPLIDTAAKLRDAQGMATPPFHTVALNENPEQKPDALELLWTFIPVEAGWLHLPIPNATLSILDKLRHAGGEVEETSSRSRNKAKVKRTAGAIGFENRPGVTGYSDERRLWSFTLTDVDDASLLAVFDIDNTKIASANIELCGGSILFDGALPVTPFRQTAERLLPDHAERALSTTGFLAVSPDLLRDVEADIWALENNKGPLLRVTLSVDALSFSPANGKSQLSGGLSLDTHLHPSLLANPDAARAPWLWVRQSMVPSIQTMPLAVAGSERRKPSGTRELAPLRKIIEADKPSVHQSYRFSKALNMTLLTPCFEPNGEWERPTNQDISWVDEVGMVLLGLPSVTLYPGLSADFKTDPERLQFDDFEWSAKLTSPISIEVRFDLAIRDEAFASSALPRRMEVDEDDPQKPPKKIDNKIIEPEENLTPEPRVFEPRRDNGPDGPIDESLHESRSVWLGVWSGLQRDLALSATEQRAMLIQNDADIQLQGVFGDARTVVEVDFSAITSIKNELDDGVHSYHDGEDQPWWLISIGQWELSIGGNAFDEPFYGLPSEDDLIGLNGFLPSGRDEELVFGTAMIESDESGFYDQRGFSAGWAEPSSDEGNTVTRTVTIGEVDSQDTAQLITAETPFVEQGGALRFWFADVPLNETGTSLHSHAKLKNVNGTSDGAPPDSNQDWMRHLVNAASYANSPLQGYRWWLSSSFEAVDELIVVAGVQFMPLQLHSMTVSNGILASVEILGRPSLRLEGENTEPRGTDGLVMLLLTFDGLEFSASINDLPSSQSNKLRWPLARRAGFESPVPVLQLDNWPKQTSLVAALEQGTKKQNGVVTAVLDGLQFDVPVFAYFDEDRKLNVSVCDEGPKQDSNHEFLWASGLELSVTPLDVRAPMTLTGASLKITGYIGHKNPEQKWGVAPVIELDLQKPGLPATLATGELTLPVFDSMNITASIAKTIASEEAILVGMDHNGLLLEWEALDDESRELENAFIASDFKGMLSIGLTEGQPDNKPPPEDKLSSGRKLRLKVNTAMLDVSAKLSVFATRYSKQQELTLQMHRGDSMFRLFGELIQPNLFSWPDLAMPANPLPHWNVVKAAANLDSTVKHKATIQFDGQPFHGFRNGLMTLAAHVQHRIDWESEPMPVPEIDENAEVADNLNQEMETSVVWSMLQAIRFESIEVLRTSLEKDQNNDGARAALAELSVLAVENDYDLGIDHLKAADQIFRNKASQHSDIRGSMRDVWLEETKEIEGVVVSLSSHHQLNWNFDEDKGGRDWVVLPLPHMSVLSKVQWDLSPALDAIFTSSFDQSKTFWLHGSDLPRQHALAQPERSVLSDARARLALAVNAKSDGPIDAVVHPGDSPALALGLDELLDSKMEKIPYATRSVFQYFTLTQVDSRVRLGAIENPAFHHACVLGVLKVRGLDRSPQAFGFTQGGDAAAAVSHEGQTDIETLKASLFNYAQRLAGHLVAVPTLIEGATKKSEGLARSGYDLTLHAVSPDGQHIRKITQRFSSKGQDAQSDVLRDLRWSSQTLMRLASWTRHGSLVRESATGERELFLLPRPDEQSAPPERDVRPTLSATIARGLVPEVQRVAPPENYEDVLPKRLVPGFSAVASGAALWASDLVENDGSITGGPRLSATASETVWRLEGGVAPYLDAIDTTAKTYRLHDSSQVSFREAHAWKSDDARQRVTTALPDKYEAALPAGMHPVATNACVEPVVMDKNVQTVVPGQALIARLADRPGVWAETRLGLDGNGLNASERPLNLRLPRPPILGQNDRTRSSSHEQGHHVASANPTFILHGPRAARPGVGGSDAALNRHPRSQWATLLQLASPSKGLITERWDGELKFDAVGSTRVEEWRVKKAIATIGEIRFSAVLDVEKPPKLDQPVVSFVDANSGNSLKNVALSVRPATPIEFTLEVQTVDDQGVTLTRQLRFELLSAGTGLGMPEVPIYLRFDDPEYNDRLNGVSRTYSQEPAGLGDEPDITHVEEIVLAVDRSDVRPTDRLEIALGFRFGENPVAEIQRRLFKPDEKGRATIGNKLVQLNVARNRTDNGEAVNTKLRSFDWLMGADATDVLAMSLSLQDELVLPDGALEPLLQTDDEIVMTLNIGGEFSMTMSFDVVDVPLLPANPSAFAQLQLRHESLDHDENERGEGQDEHKNIEVSLAAPLYASGPPANSIEIVDPRDLLEGVVRRRAIYQWRSFASRSLHYRNALQKVSASGATWIEPNLAEGWSSVSGSKPES